jgi:hypothetical protein
MPHYLASGEEGLIKLIFWVIVLIVWGIGSVASAMKKAAGGATARVPNPTAAPKPPPENPKNAQPPMSAGPRLTARPAANALPAQFQFAPAASPKKNRRRAVPPPMPTARPPQSPQPPARTLSVAPPMAAIVEQTTSPASDIRILLRSGSLGNQWMICEVLAKPLALRGDDASTHGPGSL